MKVVIQRVSRSSVAVDGEVVGEIGPGLLVLVGIRSGDTDAEARRLAEKCLALRIFEDDDGRMNRSVVDVRGGILVVSQFTLLADTRKGTRPSFNDAAKPAEAVPLYESFRRHLAAGATGPLATGRFGAMMAVSLVNDGPVTLVLDSRD